MAMVPLSEPDTVRVARALRREANLLEARTKRSPWDDIEIAADRELADRIERTVVGQQAPVRGPKDRAET
jgi:hypothetical protein